MSFDRDRESRNDDVYADHKAAVRRGEKRVLRKTTDGTLHSYAADEVGFSPGRGQAQVRSWWGMGVLAVLMGALGVLSLVILLAPVGGGGQPFWGALFLLAFCGGGVWLFGGMARDELKAKRLREGREVPEPGGGNVSL